MAVLEISIINLERIIMENINVYIKCYCPNVSGEGINRPASSTGGKLIWEYLMSDALFSDFLLRKTNEIEGSIKNTGQTLNKLYVDVFYNMDDNKLSVNLDYYTKEGATQSFTNDFEIQFGEINQHADTVKKGQVLKEFLIKEIKRVDSRMENIFYIILFVAIVLPISTAIYTAESFSTYRLVIFSISLVLAVYAWIDQAYYINRCLPKETEFRQQMKI